MPSNRIFRSKKIHYVLRQQTHEVLETLSLSVVLDLNEDWKLTIFAL